MSISNLAAKPAGSWVSNQLMSKDKTLAGPGAGLESLVSRKPFPQQKPWSTTTTTTITRGIRRFFGTGRGWIFGINSDDLNAKPAWGHGKYDQQQS